MSNKFRIVIYESKEELKHRLHRTSTATSQEKLQMLYWIVSKAVQTRQELARLLGRDESRVYWWLRLYKEEGIEGLLRVKKAPGKVPHIPPEARQKLKEKLAEPLGFKSYRQIQKWLEQECQVKASYQVVQELVRYKLKAKLKQPRPQSL